MILPPPVLSINVFPTVNFLKHSTEQFTYEIFRHCETKKFRQKIENSGITLRSTKIFDTRISETLKGSFRKFFGTVRQKIFDGKSRHPPLIQTFSLPEINATVKDSYGNFGTVRQKIFDVKSWYSPPPVLSINVFPTVNFLKHSTEQFTYEIFRHCETKKFRQKIENSGITLRSTKIFDTRISETLKGSFRKFFGTVRQKIFDGKSRYFLPPLIQSFSIPEISETLKDSPTKFFGTVRQKNSTENRKSWHNRPKHKNFRYPKSVKH